MIGIFRRIIMIMKLNITLLCLTLLITSNSWWDKGHMLVSQIAWNHLTDSNNINARDKFNELIVVLNPFTDGKTPTFTEAAVWADDIKSYGVKMFDNYHFTNIVYDPDYRFNGMSQYQQDVNSINTINWCYKVLKLNKNGVSFERAWMARYLLHLVGDIHQPLHNTNMFNASFKTGDLGGNLIKITTPTGASTNLHAFFDSIALEQGLDDRIVRPLNDTYRAQLETEAREIMTKYPAESLKDLVSIKDPHAWGVQAFKVAVDKIYAYTSTNNKISQEYQAEMRETMHRSIALGGYRLAGAIADIYV